MNIGKIGHLTKKSSILVLLLSLLTASFVGCGEKEPEKIGMAVEFMDHAASAFIAEDKGWYEDEGLELASYESYVSGMALAAALARGDIQVAYICLVPAISAYANAHVPIKIVAGTHKYGYGIVVDPAKVTSVNDLEDPDIRIGCVKEGGSVDILMHKTIEVFGLDKEKVLANTLRMSPQKLALALKSGQLDAIFIPEHWATLAEGFGFEMLMDAADIWENMQGSVLVVKEDLLTEKPDTVKKLVRVSEKATDWINEQPGDAAETVSRQLNLLGSDAFPAELADMMPDLTATPAILRTSMERLEFTTDIDIEQVQETIDFMAELGYIKSSFNAEELLDLRFID